MASEQERAGAPDAPPDASDSPSDPRLDSIRAILLGRDREEIRRLAQKTEALDEAAVARERLLLTYINALQEELDQLQERNRAGQERAAALQAQIDELHRLRAAEAAQRIPELVSDMPAVLSQAAEADPAAVGSALAPAMSGAIQAQIRDSREELILALSPIILRTVQRALADFARELQRNIDARLRATLGPRGALATLWARLRGVSPSELLLRDALPFQIDEIFLIQRETGLLLAHSSAVEEDDGDSDLIGAMLTAIRDFARDSFGEGRAEEELDEIQFGEQTVLIESGPAAYVAAVVHGVEPQHFRSRLRLLVMDLHQQQGRALAAFDGDPERLPDLAPALASFTAAVTAEQAAPAPPLPREQRLALIGGGLAGLLLLALACFYLQFTVALLPVAFGATATPTPTPASTATAAPTATATPTATLSPTPTATATATATPTATATATPSLTATATPTATATATPSPTATATPLPSATPEEARSVTTAQVWLRPLPEQEAPLAEVVPAGTPLTILSQFGIWAEVQVDTPGGLRQGWIPLDWIDLAAPIPAELVTPLPPGE